MPELSADQRQRLARLRRGFQDERKGVRYFLKLLSERLDTAAGRPAAEVVTDKPATRAHLVSHPGFAELDTDEDGNPLVFLNRYECCASKWDDTWSSACDDVCPDCGRDVSPLASDWLGPSDPGLIALWKDLPDAGLDLSEADVPPTGELTAQPKANFFPWDQEGLKRLSLSVAHLHRSPRWDQTPYAVADAISGDTFWVRNIPCNLEGCNCDAQVVPIPYQSMSGKQSSLL